MQPSKSIKRKQQYSSPTKLIKVLAYIRKKTSLLEPVKKTKLFFYEQKTSLLRSFKKAIFKH